MTKIRTQFQLDDKVPIEKIPPNHCNTCLNECNNDEINLCEKCLSPPSFVQDWNFEKVYSLGVYHKFKQEGYSLPINVLSNLILLLKFRRGKSFKKFAGSLISKGLSKIFKQIVDENGEISYVIITPKFNSRDENQVNYILTPFLDDLKEQGIILEDISDHVKRLRDIGKNKEKSFKKRFIDIKGVHKIDIESLDNKNVIILDDIYTTGSTSWDLARALKDKNAGKIFVLVAGRHWLFDNWPINEIYPEGYFSLDYLINYFSNLDWIRVKDKITNVKLSNLYVDDQKIQCSLKGTLRNYSLLVDLSGKKFIHDCPDFINERRKNKKFCKHITKCFIEIGNKYGNDRSCNILNSIYRELDLWYFE